MFYDRPSKYAAQQGTVHYKERPQMSLEKLPDEWYCRQSASYVLAKESIFCRGKYLWLLPKVSNLPPRKGRVGMLGVVILATAPLVSARAMPDCDVLDPTKTGKKLGNAYRAGLFKGRVLRPSPFCSGFSRWRKRWGPCTACKRPYGDT